MGESESAAEISGTIPEEEAVFYEEVCRKEVESLSSMESMGDVARSNRSVSFKVLRNIVDAKERGGFPNPRTLWLASTFEITAEHESFQFLSPLQGKRVLQLGGRGGDAVKFMLAGAKSASLVSPVVSELRCGKELARLCGVEVDCRQGLAEDIPFGDKTFDIVYSSGCAHHFETERAVPEIARVLCAGGRFAAIDPWKAPGYSIGIRIFGKREPEVHCRPLNKERVSILSRYFAFSVARQHGTLTRYPLIALAKLGIVASPAIAWRITRLDDALCSLVHLRSLGSCVAVMAEK